jgi:hypothetical protein
MGSNLSTNLSLRTPITEGIDRNDSVTLLGDHATNMGILEKAVAGIQAAATTGVNASIINTNGNRTVLVQLLSAGSIASITGAIAGMPFSLVVQSTGSFGMLDTGVFKLNGNFLPNTNAALTLVWDGTNFTELARSTNG